LLSTDKTRIFGNVKGRIRGANSQSGFYGSRQVPPEEIYRNHDKVLMGMASILDAVGCGQRRRYGQQQGKMMKKLVFICEE